MFNTQSEIERLTKEYRHLEMMVENIDLRMMTTEDRIKYYKETIKHSERILEKIKEEKKLILSEMTDIFNMLVELNNLQGEKHE